MKKIQVARQFLRLAVLGIVFPKKTKNLFLHNGPGECVFRISGRLAVGPLQTNRLTEPQIHIDTLQVN